MCLIKPLIIIFTSFAIAGCGINAPRSVVSSKDAVESCKVIEHDLGNTEICGLPQKVVAVDPHMLDLMLSLGIQPVGFAEVEAAIVGSPKLGEQMTQIKYLGDRITSHPIYIGTRNQPSLETILRLKPDLILGELGVSSYRNLEKIAPTLFPFKDFDNYQWQQTLLKLGQVFEREQRAKQIIIEHNQRIAQAKAKLANITQNSKLLLLGMSELGTIGVLNARTFPGALLEELGFELVIPKQVSADPNTDATISLEVLPQLDADIIIVTTFNKTPQVEKIWQQNLILRSLKASQNNRVYFVDYQLWGRIRGPIAAELMIEQMQMLLENVVRS